MAKINRSDSAPRSSGRKIHRGAAAQPAGRRLSTQAAEKQRRRKRAARRVLAVQLAVSVLLVVQVYRTQMLPTPLVAAIGGVLALFWLLTLTAQSKPGRGAFMRGFAWLLSAALAVGCVFTQQGIAALQTITRGGDNTVVGVYVLADDPAQRLADAQGYTFGRLAQLDQDNTDKAVAAIAQKAPAAQTAQGYESVFALADGLYSGQVQAVLLNRSFLSLLEDEESGYTDFSQRTRCIYTYTIANPNLLGSVTGAEAKKITTQPFLLYLSGVDTRGELSDVCRSDVNILAAVDPVNKRVVLINTPRDYYVALAGAGGAMDKLTHAGLYGVDCSMETLGALYGVDVQYYMKVDFTGFVQIIDALGGVDVVSDQAFTSVGSPGYYDPTTFAEGENHLDGKAALAFARERKAFASGDVQRGINQMKVIAAVLEKVKSPAVLRGYSALMRSVSDSFLTNLSQDQVGALVQMQLSDGADWQIESYSVTGSGDYSTQCYSSVGSRLYVMQPDQAALDTARAMLAQVLSGQQQAASPAA